MIPNEHPAAPQRGRSLRRGLMASGVAIILFTHGKAIAANPNIVISSDSTSAQTLAAGGSITINPGVTLNVAKGKNAIGVNGSGTITNNGTLEESGTGDDAGRAIRDKDDPLSLIVVNNGLITTADDDDIQIQFPDNSVAFSNDGTIISENASEGGAQAIDFNAITTAANSLYNAASGLIEAYEADAVRPGVNGIIDNAGTIYSYNNAATPDDGSDGIDAQTNTGVAITNAATGIINGARHGITGGNTDVTTDGSFTMTVNNAGIIEGQDGSGINIDGFNANERVTVNNTGTITGNGVTGDGDGVDVDGLVAVNNSGTIQSLHADDDTSEGITVGGGTIVNSGTVAGYNSATNADGTANTGLGRGITLAGLDKDPTTGDAIPIQGIYANSAVTNSGLIYGQNGGAIAVTGAPNAFTVTIINTATGILESGGNAAVISTGGNNATLIDYGTIKSDGTGQAINLGSGNSNVEILGGSASVTGNIDGGTGASTLSIIPGAGASFTYAGAISNFNTLAIGAGTTILNGNSATLAATTTIGGTLEVGDAANPNAVLGGNAVLADTGILRGHGSIGGNLTNNGLVYPGGSIGTLTVNGNYTQNSNGTLEIEINPNGQSDALHVGGSASLSGGLEVNVDAGSYTPGTTYSFLTASGGVTGSFNTVTDSASPLTGYLTPRLSYSANNVALQIAPTPLAFSTGRVYAASNFVTNSALTDVLGAPLDMQYGTAAQDHGYWLHGVGLFGNANGDNFNAKGFVIGKGFAITPNLVLGGAVSNIYTTTQANASSVDGVSFGALAYGRYTAGPITVSADVTAGHLGNSINRALPGLGLTAKSTSNGTYQGAQARLQYSLLTTPNFFITPYAQASYLHTLLGSAQETNAGILNLRYQAISTSLGQLGGGITGGYVIALGTGTLTPWASLGGLGTLGNPHTGNTELLGNFASRQTALTAPAGAFTPGVGIQFAGNSAWRLAADWGGQFGSATATENFALQASTKW